MFTAGPVGGSGDTTGTSGPLTAAGCAGTGGTGPSELARWTDGACPPVRTAPPDRAGGAAEPDAGGTLGGVTPSGAVAPAGADADVAAAGLLGAVTRAGEAGPPAAPGPPPGSPGTRGGISRSGTAGARWTVGCPGGPADGRAPAGCSRPDTGRPDDERDVSPSSALDRPSSTA
ncbi:hypothetical protein ABZX30_04900 [Streptomyces sp. NPDC004542]|uniref:hypothetical protein n=1 Tax=Streptomyces sp. NPDC004542 TaxID=3154281 RepID=UPI0033AB27E7